MTLACHYGFQMTRDTLESLFVKTIWMVAHFKQQVFRKLNWSPMNGYYSQECIQWEYKGSF